MKRIAILMLIFCLTLSLAACGTKDNSVDTQNNDTSNSESEEESAENEDAEASGENTGDQESGETENSETVSESQGEGEEAGEETTSKTLIVYFTPANSDTADAISEATPRVGEVASVEHIANIISANISADVARIVVTDAYPLEYRPTTDRAMEEQNNDDRPEFTLDVNPEGYDTIILGYPIWWYRVPMVLQTFFETYNLDGKTIVPYVLHGGSRDGGTFREITELVPGATVLDGIAVHGDRADRAENDVIDWLKDLGLME